MKVEIVTIRLGEKHLPNDLKEAGRLLSTSEIRHLAMHYVDGKDPAWNILVIGQDLKKAAKNNKSAAESAAPPSDEFLTEKLKAWRNTRAREMNLPPWSVFNNETINGIVNLRPATLEDLSKIRGLGQKKIEKFGSEILKLLSEI